jgi:hypothetical protein
VFLGSSLARLTEEEEEEEEEKSERRIGWQ